MAAALLAGHIVAGVLVFFSGVVSISALCCLVLAGSAVFSYRRYILFTGPGVLQAAVWHADGSWTVESADGVERRARLLPSTFVHPRLVVLHFRLRPRGRRHMVLCADSINSDDMRRLRARLRLGGLQETA
jgi:hypothetical protein